MCIFALNHGKPLLLALAVRVSPFLRFDEFDGEIEVPVPLQGAMEMVEYQRPVFGGHKFHGIHTDDAVEGVSEIDLLQALLFRSHLRKFGPGLHQHLLGLIDTDNGPTALQD